MPNGLTKPLSAPDIPVFWVATTTRSTNAFSGSLPTTPTLTAGLAIRWQVPSAPSGAATYNLNGLGAKNIYVRGSANVAADLPANRIITMVYDGTQWLVTACNTVVAGDLPLAVFPLSSVSGTNTITATASVTPATGMLFSIIAANTISGAATLNINSGGAVNLRKQDGSTALASGDLIAGKLQLLYFDGTVYRVITGLPLAAGDIPSGIDMAKMTFAGIALSKSADQTGIVANTITDVTWTLETVSESSHLSHSTSSNTEQITVNTAGKYGIEVTLTLENTGSSNTYGLYNIYLYVNGTAVAIQQFSLYGSTATRPIRTIRAGWIRPLAATDVVKIAGYAASDNHDIKGQSSSRDQTTLLMTYLGA